MKLLNDTRMYQALFPGEAETEEGWLYRYACEESDKFEAQLVPLSSAFTNRPLAPDFKVTVGKEE